MLFIVPKYKLWFSLPHPGILYIASAARNAGEKVELIDGGLLQEKKIYERILAKAPAHDFIALTASVAHISSAVRIARFVREKFPQKKIIWGGPYPSSQDQNLGNDLADIIVLGEGEKQISDICRSKNLSDIPSLIYFREGERIQNKRNGYIENLDELPFPAYDLVNFSHYNNPGLKPTGSIISTRGCPYRCINCTKIIHGDTYRKRSPENVVEEIKMLVNHFHVREIHFWDDNLTLDVNRVKKICDLILSKNLNKKTRFAVPSGIRADIYDEEMFSLMKKAGFYLISIAVESGEQKIINRIDKKLNLNIARENIKKIEKHGFRLMLYFMMGFPFETEEDMNKTANFAASLPGQHLNCFSVIPLPGSKLFEEWEQTPNYKNYLSVTYDSPIPVARSPEKHKIVKKYIRKTYFKFYFNPIRISKTIIMMIKDGSIFNDMKFLFKVFLNICIKGHK